jgi:hypothetical protein
MSAERARSSGGHPPARARPYRGTLRALREELSEAEWVQFTEEAEEALSGALLQPEPGLQPLLDVIEAWYRTMIVRQDLGYQEATARYAGKTPEELGERVYKAEDLRRLLHR